MVTKGNPVKTMSKGVADCEKMNNNKSDFKTLEYYIDKQEVDVEGQYLHNTQNSL